MKLRLLAIPTLLLPAVLVTAQSDRITVRMAPAPNQTLHLHTTQETAITTDADTPARGTQPFPATSMHLHTSLDTTSVVGPTDSDGHYTAKMTVDTVSATATMDGREMPLPITTADAAKLVIIFAYDDQGRVIDVSTEGPSVGMPPEAIKQVLSTAFATAAPMTLSIGESVTVPTALSLPVPFGSAAAMGVAGETRYTLTAITFDGADRVAHLASHMRSTIEPGSAGPPVALSMTTTGDGKTDVNVDRGIVLHTEQQLTIEGSMRVGTAGQAAPPNIHIHGTFAIVSDLVK